MIAFIDDHRGAYGVEPICRVLPIAPSPYHEHAARRRDPARLPARARRDLALQVEVRRVFAENFQVCGVRKVWRQLRREGVGVARCTVARLMQRLWSGFVCVAFVIDACARRIVGWRASRTTHAGFVLDALEQALHARCPLRLNGLVHHPDRGSQYVAIRYTERLAEAGIEPSVGSVGDSYDNALAETVIGLFKTELIHRRGPCHSFEAVEFATLEWVDWFNHRRLLEPIGNVPAAEAEDRYFQQARAMPIAARFDQNSLRQTRSGSVTHLTSAS